MAAPPLKQVRRVLVFNDLGSISSPGFALTDQAIFTSLEKSPYQIEFYNENLETTFFSDRDSQREFREWYVRKYRDRQPDVIIAVGQASLEFMIEVHETAFPNVPVVFCATTEDMIEDLKPDSHLTGVWAVAQPEKTLKAALQLQPDTQHVVVVGGVGGFDRDVMAIVKNSLRDHESKLDFIYLTDLDMPALLERLKHLPSKSIVFHTSIMQDAAGARFIDATQSLPMVVAAANAPVFVIDDVDLREGAVGGNLLSWATTGQIAAKMAIRVLNGEKPQNIPIVKSATVNMFDWRAMQRWGFKESDLPPGSIVINRRPTVWDLYKRYIVGGVALLVAQMVLIFGLLWQRKRRRSSEEYSRNLVLGSPVAMIVSRGPRRENELVNRKFTELFGYTIEDMPDEATWWTLSFPEQAYREQVKAEWNRRLESTAIEPKSLEPMEASVRCKDGLRRHVEFHVASMGDSNLVTFVDLTERRQVEIALRESEERFRLVANTAPVMIWMAGTDKMCNYFNQPWLEFTGRPLEAELGNGWAEGVHPEDLRMCWQTYSNVFDRREPFQMQHRLRHKKLGYRWILNIGVPRFNRDDSFAGYIGSCLDVTERKEAEHALARLSGRLIHAQEQERKRIAREIHDDYNQRLAVLANDIDELAENAVAFPVEASQRLHQLWNTISELGADLHSLSHRLHSSTLESLGLVAGTKAFCQEFEEQQHIQVDFAHEDVPHGIPGDLALCLFRVTQEGLRNIKRHSGAKRAEVRLERLNGKIHLSIVDRGKGFDPNQRSGREGIGIWSMEERLRALGGSLDIRSRPEEGTRIDAWLPLKGSRQNVA